MIAADKEMASAIMKCLGDVAQCVICPSSYVQPPNYISVPLDMGEQLSYGSMRDLSALLHTQDIVLESSAGDDYDEGPWMELKIRGWRWP